MEGPVACSSFKEFAGNLSSPGITFDQKVSMQLYHDSKKSWEDCVEILRSGALAENGLEGDPSTLMLCAVTLKHHAYNHLKLLFANSEKNPLKVALHVETILTELCLRYYGRNDLIRQQLLCALCGVIINYYDVNINEYDFMLNSALRRFDGNLKLQCELLQIFPDEMFNISVHCSSVKRADLARGSVMYSPRIIVKLFEMIRDPSRVPIMEPLRALLKWLEMHVKLVRAFEGTHAFVHDEDQGNLNVFSHDSMLAKIPRDDAVLIRNGLNAMVTVGGFSTLFDMVRESIEKLAPEICEVVCDTLTQLYSLIQIDLIWLLYSTSNRYNDSVSQSVRHWTTCSKLPISQLPSLVTESCSCIIKFCSELPQMMAPVLAFGKSKHDEDISSRSRILVSILELLVTIAGEHVAFTLLFSETQGASASNICAFVREALKFPDFRCRELCLDFYSSLMSVLFAARDGLAEPYFSTCVLRIVQSMRALYSDFVTQVIKTSVLDFNHFDEQFQRYRTLVSAFIDETMHIVGINMLLQMLQDMLKQLSEHMDWAKAECCVFLVSAIAHRLTPDLSECIVLKLLSMVCSITEFREFYRSHGSVALYVHKSICDCLVVTCGIVAQDNDVMKAAQELCLMEFCDDSLFEQHAALALRALALCANYSISDIYGLMKRLSSKVLVPELPFDARVELLGCIADLVGSFNDSAKIRLSRDFITAMSQRLNVLLENSEGDNLNQDIVLYLSALFVVDFRTSFTIDINNGSSREILEENRRNHESRVLQKLTQLGLLWPQVNLCQEGLNLDRFSTPDEVDNLGRWLLWLLKEAPFGSRTHLLVVKTILQSVKLCMQDSLLNTCMDVVDQYVSRLLCIMMEGVDTLDADASHSITPRNHDDISREGSKASDSFGAGDNDSSSVTGDSEAERPSRSHPVQVITDYIVANANRFREEGDLSELDLFTSAIRSGVSNQVSALKLLSWPKFGKYVAFMALLLPTDNPEINKEIMELFLSIVLWTSATQRGTNDMDSQKQKLTKNAAKAILMGKHFIQCNLTMAEFITSAMFKALLSKPSRVDEWLSPATRILHTLIASNTFYPVVTTSIRSCVRGSSNKKRKVIGRKISMSSCARGVRHLLWTLATDNPEPGQVE